MFARQLKADKEELVAATFQGRSPKPSLEAKHPRSSLIVEERIIIYIKEIYMY
jgi:hypothetical protein